MKYLILASTLALTPAAYAQSTAWTSDQSVDPMTDVSQTIAVTSIDRHSNLAFICQVGELIAYAQTNYIDMEFGDRRNVTWRVDQNPPVKQAWSNVRKGGAFTSRDDAKLMAEAVKAAEARIVVRSGGETRTFTANGSTQAINEVLDACSA